MFRAHPQKFPLNRRQFAAWLAASLPLVASAQARKAVAAHGHFAPQSPMSFGAKGDGQTDDTHALQAAINQASAAGGGCVALDPGHTFLSSTLVLKAHVEFHLSGGSVLKTSPNREAFHEFGALLFARDAEDIHVSGTGTIDGNFQVFFPPKSPDGYPVPQPFLGPYDPLYEPSNRNPPDGRPRIILLVNCRKTLLEHFTIRDAPTSTIPPVGCDDLHISGLSIHNNLDVPNCDGIDIDHCRDVRIDNCDIIAGDDCLVLKASRNFGEFGPCENITITNCTLESSSAGIKIETEGDYPLRSAVISNCSIVRSNRGISFLNRDGATVEDILFTGLTIETRMRPLMWWGSGEAVALSSVPRTAGGPAGLVRGISFTDLLCRGESGIYLRGTPGAPLRDISFRNLDLSIERTTQIPGGFYDMRPGDAFGASGLDRRNLAGFFAAQVDGLDLGGLRIHWPGTPPAYFGAALELHQCSGISLIQVHGEAAHSGQPPAIYDGVTLAPSLSAPA